MTKQFLYYEKNNQTVKLHTFGEKKSWQLSAWFQNKDLKYGELVNSSFAYPSISSWTW